MIVEHKDFSQKERDKLAEKNQAMPHGGYPIRNRADLQKAIQAFGRAKDPEATKRWIIKRANELNATDLIPDTWKGVSHSVTTIDEFLAHHGVKGMHWGVRHDKPDNTNYDQYEKERQRKALGRKLVATVLGRAAAGIAVGTVAGTAAARFVSKKVGGDSPFSSIAGFGVGYIGSATTVKLLNAHGNKKLNKKR